MKISVKVLSKTRMVWSFGDTTKNHGFTVGEFSGSEGDDGTHPLQPQQSLNRKSNQTPPMLEGNPFHTNLFKKIEFEGPKYAKKDNLLIKLSDDAIKPQPFDPVSIPKYGQIQDAKAVTGPFGHFTNGGSIMMEASHAKAPRSPTSTTYQKRVIRTDVRTQIPTLQLPKSPEPPICARNEVQNMMQSELTLFTDFQTPNLIGSANGKGSQIRRSLQTIGKLIYGSEKRNQQNLMELQTPIKGGTNVIGPKSPVRANARSHRRQSLTGIPASGSDKSQRSSLGGKS